MDLQLKSDPESEQYLASQAGEPSPSTVGENRDGQKKNPVRKRTKTGCLTCRRRRIKCDEAKPRCTNCTKSRRVCEGYNQRITFKEPVSSYHPHPGFFGHSQPAFIPHAPDPLTAAQLAASQHARAGIPPGNLTVIAPKPPEFYHFQEVYPPQPTPSNGPPSATLSQNQFSPHNDPPNSSFNHPHLHTPVSAHAEYPADGFFNVVSPSMTEESDGMFAQYSAFDDRAPQPLSRTTAYQPPETRDRNEEHSIHYSESQEDPYWSPDDEASMGESEDEDGYEAMTEADQAHLESNDLGIQVARRMDRQAEYYDARIRTFTGFVDANNVLDTYMPSSTNSPLNDTQTASVFWYFVNVTGRSMSLYERHPFDPSPMFQGQPVPKARRHIWTYTFPIISFNHPALLQAMLALGSLQMAKLQGIPATASMKHYHLSLRRIAKNYQSPTRRTQPATLAATLLLGFYEVWNSDHAKWCKHMWGARAIIREIPFKDMTKAVLGLKRKRRQRLHDLLRRQQQQPQGNFGAVDPFSVPMNEDISNVQPDFTDVNTGLISQITGTTVTYEDFGHIYNEDGQRKSARKYTDRDVETYEHLSDLYWWYCKMDVYQSILGATSLFMEYDLWTQCAPRGPFNNTGAIFGTYDHLMLLLGRMCNFVAQDINRKRKTARRGQTAAPAGAAGQRPAGMGMAPGQSPPMWAGLVPTSEFVTVPTGFSPPRDATPQSDGSDDIDFEESSAAALREWDSIRKAFEIFRTNLGPDFDPLGPDLGPPQPTPFGPAATYRTFSIAGIWMNYYMGLIALHRAHPSRPPFAMVAAGMAAQETGMWANELGRIAAGLTMEDCSNLAGISTLVGAAFIESCFCLFVAAVQYRDEAQRHWTVRRLHDIGRLTGWQSAIQIAEGCESAWLKAAQIGKGPPYQRPPDVESQLSQSAWQNLRRIDRRIHELSGERPASNILTKSEQAHYALGLLSLENDLERLELGEAG